MNPLWTVLEPISVQNILEHYVTAFDTKPQIHTFILESARLFPRTG